MRPEAGYLGSEFWVWLRSAAEWWTHEKQMQLKSRNKDRINIALKLNKHALYVHFIDGTIVASHIFLFVNFPDKYDGINSINEMMRTAQFAYKKFPKKYRK